jgi:hypothetical protein
MTRISGPTSLPFSASPAAPTFKSDLFYDYRTNLEAYPKWQAWMREEQPRLLVLWGKYESSFDPSEPESYRGDVPNAHFTTQILAPSKAKPEGCFPTGYVPTVAPVEARSSVTELLP